MGIRTEFATSGDYEAVQKPDTGCDPPDADVPEHEERVLDAEQKQVVDRKRK